MARTLRESDAAGTIVRASVLAPTLALTVALLWHFTVRDVWPPDEVTLAEAAATGNRAEVLRLLSLGADPRQPARVRRGLLTSNGEVVTTALAAGVLARSPETVAVILANSPAPDQVELQRLRCYEVLSRDSTIEERLRALDGGRPLDCAAVPPPFPN